MGLVGSPRQAEPQVPLQGDIRESKELIQTEVPSGEGI